MFPNFTRAITRPFRLFFITTLLAALANMPAPPQGNAGPGPRGCGLCQCYASQSVLCGRRCGIFTVRADCGMASLVCMLALEEGRR